MNAFFWALITACIWGVVPILEKIGLAKIDPFVGLFYRCCGILIGLLVLGTVVVKPHQLKSVDLKTIMILVTAGLLASFVAQITFYQALKIGEVSKVVPVSGTYYLVTFLLGILFFKEAVTPAKITGIVMVVSGMLLLR